MFRISLIFYFLMTNCKRFIPNSTASVESADTERTEGLNISFSFITQNMVLTLSGHHVVPGAEKSMLIDLSIIN